jgi:hypothetical protein
MPGFWRISRINAADEMDAKWTMSAKFFALGVNVAGILLAEPAQAVR